ncbi:hypothetical protein [Tenacibaculum soleae]|uniref:hypothetical protein n=1 Tax=Tenacibaculum soleae TaxID=447689 RepID=UPI003AB4D414
MALLLTVLYFLVNHISNGRIVKFIEGANIFHFLWIFIMSFFTIKKIIELRIHFTHPDKKVSDLAKKIVKDGLDKHEEDIDFERRFNDTL